MDELGIYLDFPSFAHLDVRFSLTVSGNDAVNLIAVSLSRLNNLKDHMNTSVAGHSDKLSVERSFETGIAEGLYFNYLDEHEVNRLSKISQPPSSIDFIVYINYRYLKRNRPVSLLSDRYLVRISLTLLSLKVFQISGLRRTVPEDLVMVIAGMVNMEAKSYGFDRDIMRIEGLEEFQKN